VVPRSWLAAIAGLAVLIATAAATAQQRAAEPPARPGQGVAIFAGGCFWCMEPPFDKLDGVTATVSGYTGGTVANPTYEQVSSGRTGHYEAVRVEYDPTRVTYERLLDVFWHNIDPLDGTGQFCDKGPQYLSAIFPRDEQQRSAAEASKAALEQAGKLRGPIVTRILPAGPFYPAEEYHQDFYKKSPLKYAFYRRGCGRDARLEQVWGPAAKE
jgi:peptide-methionine (S)-S-oxide reductase